MSGFHILLLVFLQNNILVSVRTEQAPLFLYKKSAGKIPALYNKAYLIPVT